MDNLTLAFMLASDKIREGEEKVADSRSFTTGPASGRNRHRVLVSAKDTGEMRNMSADDLRELAGHMDVMDAGMDEWDGSVATSYDHFALYCTDEHPMTMLRAALKAETETDAPARASLWMRLTRRAA